MLESVYYPQITIVTPSVASDLQSVGFNPYGIALNSAFFTGVHLNDADFGGDRQARINAQADQFISRFYNSTRNTLYNALRVNNTIFESDAAMEAFTGYVMLDIEMEVSLFDLQTFSQERREGVIEATSKSLLATRELFPNAKLTLYGLTLPSGRSDLSDESFLFRTELAENALKSNYSGLDELYGIISTLYPRFHADDVFNNGNPRWPSDESYLEYIYNWARDAVKASSQVARSASEVGRDIKLEAIISDQIFNVKSDYNNVSVLDIIPEDPNAVVRAVYEGAVAGGIDHRLSIWQGSPNADTIALATAINDISNGYSSANSIKRSSYSRKLKRFSVDFELSDGIWDENSLKPSLVHPTIRIGENEFEASSYSYTPNVTIDGGVASVDYAIPYFLGLQIEEAVDQENDVVISFKQGLVMDNNNISVAITDLPLEIVDDRDSYSLFHSWGTPGDDPRPTGGPTDWPNQQGYAHFIWTVKNFYPMAIDLMKATIATPEDKAVELADNIQINSEKLSSVERIYDQYSLYIIGYGKRDGMNLLRHPDDIVAGYDGGTSSPFIANGVSEVRDYSERFFAALKNELDSRGLAYPLYCHTDFEDGIGGIDVVQGGSDDKGWLQKAIDDPRYDTEVLDGNNTFKWWIENWRNQEGEPLSWDDNFIYWNNDVNRDLREFMSNFNKVLRSYALYKSYWQPFKNYFQSVGTSNYQEYAASSNYAVIGSGKLDADIFVNARPFADISSPVYYPISGTALTGSQSEPADWFATFNVDYDDQSFNGDDYLNLNLARVEQHHNAISNAEEVYTGISSGGKNIAPWVDYHSRVVTISSGNNITLYEPYFKDLYETIMNSGSNQILFWHDDFINSRVWDSAGTMAMILEDHFAPEEGGDPNEGNPFSQTYLDSSQIITALRSRKFLP